MSGAPLMRMEPETLRRSAKKMGNAGDDLQDVLNTLRAALEAEGSCWGSDEAGQSFSQNYEPNSQKLLDAIGQTSKAIGDISANLKSTADDTEANDQQQGGEFTHLRAQI